MENGKAVSREKSHPVCLKGIITYCGALDNAEHWKATYN